MSIVSSTFVLDCSTTFGVCSDFKVPFLKQVSGSGQVHAKSETEANFSLVGANYLSFVSSRLFHFFRRLFCKTYVTRAKTKIWLCNILTRNSLVPTN